MLWNLANLRPFQYTTFITINADKNHKTVGSVAKKLGNYEIVINGPMQVHISAVIWSLQEELREMRKEVINKITVMSSPTSKKETQAFLGAIGFWTMNIPEYSQIVSPLYLVTGKKNDFHWGPEQQQAFTQIKKEIAHAVVLGQSGWDQR
ncbi:hypothetical protein TURU_123122 [Turdus rufiventris]|nr:hypothetical protein TURU_123122 [Turdus rufiventris]